MAGAQKRFERLGLVNKILRDARRDRYDHFLVNGFPKWRGTGYFYERYRPGLISVVAFLVLASAAIQRLIMGINYQRDHGRLQVLIRSAKLVAFGPGFENPEGPFAKSVAAASADGAVGRTLSGERKVRVPLSGFDSLPAPPHFGAVPSEWEEHERTLRKHMATQSGGGAGRLVDIFVSADGNSVAAVDPASGERLPLDADAVPPPSFWATWPFAAFKSTLAKVAGGSSTAAAVDNDVDDEVNGTSVTRSASSTAVAANGGSKSKKSNSKKRK